MKNKEKGLFISFEGLDSSGKTTQQELLERKIKDKAIKITGFSNSVIGDCLRDLRKKDWFMRLGYGHTISETMLFLGEMSYRSRENIHPLIDEGKIVLKDRYILTVLAYQGYFWINENNRPLNEFYNLFFPLIEKDAIVTPDITVLQYSDMQTLYRRIEQKDKRTLSASEREILEGVQNVFYELIEPYERVSKGKGKRLLCIDTTNQDIRKVHKDIINNLEDLL